MGRTHELAEKQTNSTNILTISSKILLPIKFENSVLQVTFHAEPNLWNNVMGTWERNSTNYKIPEMGTKNSTRIEIQRTHITLLQKTELT